MQKFSMQDYTGVNERMKLAADTWQTIVVAPPVMLTDTAGYVSATVVLKDGRSVTEIAAFRFGLTGQSAQATFPIEDAATSAIGRALGRFGFGTDAHFPSREEMVQVERVQAHARPAKPQVTLEQAEAKFWERFGAVLGYTDWKAVQSLLETTEEKPTTIDGWRNYWRWLDEALTAEAATVEA